MHRETVIIARQKTVGLKADFCVTVTREPGMLTHPKWHSDRGVVCYGRCEFQRIVRQVKFLGCGERVGAVRAFQGQNRVAWAMVLNHPWERPTGSMKI